jgi:hypothetical protein
MPRGQARADCAIGEGQRIASFLRCTTTEGRVSASTSTSKLTVGMRMISQATLPCRATVADCSAFPYEPLLTDSPSDPRGERLHVQPSVATAHLFAGGGALRMASATAQPSADSALRVVAPENRFTDNRGEAPELRLRAPQVASDFVRDERNGFRVDNSGTAVLDALGRRWKRLFQDATNVPWFGAVGDGRADDTEPVQG